MLLHDLEELDDDLGRRPDQDLALASLLGVVDALKSVIEDGGSDHFGGSSKGLGLPGGRLRFSSRGNLDLRYLQKTSR